MIWCQFVIYYEDGIHSLKTRVDAGVNARKIIKSLRLVAKRSFYLYEFFLKEPHIFIAFEVPPSYLWLIRVYHKFLTFWIKGGKITEIRLRENTKDWKNGETFLNVLSAWCNTLSDDYMTFITQQPGRIKGLTQVHHMTHCMMNALFGDRSMEINLYKQMLKWYKVRGSTLKKT